MKEQRRRGRPPGATAERTKQKLLSAARDLFAKGGFSATSVRDIAARAGVTEAALYGHFANKAALYQALYERAGAQSVVRILDGIGSPEALAPAMFLPMLVHELMNAWAAPESRKFTSIFTRELADRRQGGVKLFETIGEAVDRLANAFRTWRRFGLIAATSPDATLAWEVLAPLAYLRLAYLQIHATTNDIERAQTLANAHIASFIGALEP